MKAGPDQQSVQSRAVLIGRAVLAAILALSFLAVLVPLTSASRSGLMVCCIGKAGHESGSCSTGLIASGAHTEVPEVSQPKAQSTRFANVKGGVGAGEHCGLHATANGHADITRAANTTEESKSTSASKTSGLSNIHSISSTCPAECGMCSVSYTRRPRPREQSTQSSIIGPNLPLLSLIFISDDEQARLLNPKWSQLQPRAPPAFLA